jgi:hypothetical protein
MKYQIPGWHDEEKWVSVTGGCPSTVAEAAAEEHLHQTAEYGIVDTGETLRVRVVDDAGDLTEWEVRAESTINYYADKA